MDIKLNAVELRIIGCLIEKEVTTPDQYPLSLNALTNACNQKSNREPVMSLDESTVQQTLDELSKKHLVVEKSPFGGRTSKFQHRFCNTEFGDFHFSEQEVGVLCVMFLRGPQTPGELRTRTNRLCKFSDVDEVEAVLEKMAAYKSGPLVKKLARQPGKRESRYVHLLGDADIPDDFVPASDSDNDTIKTAGYEQRIAQLEKEMIDIRAEVSELKSMIDELIQG